MSWKGTAKFALGIFTVLAKAPADSGLYALFTRDEWIYIGETENIQVQLLQLLNSPGPLVLRYGVTSFAYECVPPPGPRIAAAGIDRGGQSPLRSQAGEPSFRCSHER